MKPMKFSKLKVGQKFTMSDPTVPGCEGSLKYVNIKIAPAIFSQDGGKEQIKFTPEGKPDYSEGYDKVLPFNVIALEDGRVRTFFPDNTVYPVEVEGKV